MKMNGRNQQLKEALGNIPSKSAIEEIQSIPETDCVNRSGQVAYKLDDKLRLLSMLNTIKLEPQYYRTENEILVELRDLIEKLALENPYFVAQAIVYSRCVRDGMRSINHLAAVLLAPFISNTSWGQYFYSPWRKKEGVGGCIYRLDDMTEIKDAFVALSKSKLTNAMKKGFARTLQVADGYQLTKYKKTTINIANLTHPNPNLCLARVKIDGKDYAVVDALMKGISIPADTWETSNSEAGQLVSKAKKEGKLTEVEAQEILKGAKLDNWTGLLKEGKLGILACLRNLRNIMSLKPSTEVIDMICTLISNQDNLIKGKIMPYQLDYAYEALKQGGYLNSKIQKALENSMSNTIINLGEILKGNNLIILDCSGSMGCNIRLGSQNGNTSCIKKASLIAAMIAKGCNADIIQFGDRAKWFSYNPKDNLFEISSKLPCNMGCTNLASAFNLVTQSSKKYDRIFILSDNECNVGYQVKAYQDLIRQSNSPYIYSIDLASYGTTPLKNIGKVNYYYGYGYALFDDILTKEFNPSDHISEVLKVSIM